MIHSCLVDRRGDGGFTLIEMLIVVSLMAIVLGPILVGITLSVRTTSESRSHIEEAAWAQVTASYFLPDAQAAIGIQTGSRLACDPGSVATFESRDPEEVALTSVAEIEWRLDLDSTGTLVIERDGVIIARDLCLTIQHLNPGVQLELVNPDNPSRVFETTVTRRPTE